MKWPPIDWHPVPFKVFNGAPAWSQHALDTDRATTYLAMRKAHVPTLLGEFTSGQTYELVVRIPPFTNHVAVDVHAVGDGVVTVQSDDDTYDVDITIVHTDGASPDVADALWFTTGAPLDSPGADGNDRAPEVTFADSWRNVRFEWSIADAAGNTLTLYAMRFRPVYPDETADLSTAT